MRSPLPFSIAVGLGIALGAGQARAEGGPSGSLVFPSLVERQAFDAGNPLARYAALLDLESRYLADPALRGTYLEVRGRLEASLGDPWAGPRTQAALRRAGHQRPMPDSAPFDACHAEGAVEAIAAAAERGGHRVVMVGEESLLPQTRCLLEPLLVRLKAQGFRYLAADAFAPSIATETAGGFPTSGAGPALHDPVFAQAVRVALRLGYTLVPYDRDDPNRRGLGPVADANLRAEIQAENLQARVLDADPSAKVLVWATRAHVAERPGRLGPQGAIRMMACCFKERTGIDPLTVYAARYVEGASRDREDPLYRYAIGKGLVRRPTAFVGPDGRTWSATEDVDLEVFFPRVELIRGRADWLAGDLGRIAVDLPPTLASAGPDRLRLVQAFAEGEPDRAVPVDQFLAVPGAELPALMLPAGSYRVRVIDRSGEGLAACPLTVGAGPGLPAPALAAPGLPGANSGEAGGL